MEKGPNRIPTISAIIIVAVLGLLTGVGFFQLASQGQLPFQSKSTPFKEAIEERSQKIIKEENAIIEVVEKSSPSVVAIGATRRVFNPFDPFSLPRNQSSTIGTGFVVSENGILVTNNHVVADTSTKYSVVTKDGKKYEVRRIYRDPVLDLAIVQIDGNDLKPLELGTSSQLKVGQTVIAIGNALGRFTNTVTAGIVSGMGRKVVAGDPFSGSAESLDDLIQTDAAINPGNSGGPLLNSSGQVIGVSVAMTEGAQNIGFAIPIDAVKKIVDEFVQNGVVSRPYLGVKYRFISKDLALLNEVPQGAYIQEIIKDSPADKAGIEAGDIITKIDGQAITEENKISSIISGKKISDSVSVTVWTDGTEKQVTAVLQELTNQ